MKPVLLLAALVCVACGAQPPDVPVRSAPVQLDHGDVARAQAMQEVRRLIGEARCTGNQACRTIALGARACGGPQDYLAWSVQQTDGRTLATAAERANRLARAALANSDALSTCEHVPDPGALCVAGQCRPGAGGTRQ